MVETKILLVACQHGDEPFGANLMQVIEHTPELKGRVDTLMANPRAFAQNVRYTQTDMNRSFDVAEAPASYEQSRAHDILAHISGRYKYIVDVHTGKRAPGSSIIATNLDPATQRVINSHDSTTVALMPPELGKNSLIGQFVSGAVSMEYNEAFARSEKAHEEVTDCLQRLVDVTIRQPKLRGVLIISGLIGLDEALNPSIDYNLQKLPDGKSYGYLVGDPAYTTHQGFRASHMIKVRI